ncbi:MAG: DNA primase [Planctomycetaceae bacterium]|jgi:DNA primase
MNLQPKSSVVVPVDFSGHCVEAIRTALQFVEQPAHVHLIHVVVPLESNSPAVLLGEVDKASREQRVREYFADYTRENQLESVTRHHSRRADRKSW